MTSTTQQLNHSTTIVPPFSLNSTLFDIEEEDDEGDERGKDVGYLALHGLSAVIAAYLFTGQFIYCYRHFGCHFGNLSSRKKLGEVLLLVAPILAILAVTLRIVQTLLEMHILSDSELVEGLFGTFIVMFYFTFLMVTYSLLWLRQRVVYVKPSLYHVSNRPTRILSKYFIIYIVATGVATFTAILVLNFADVCSENCDVAVLLVLALIIWPLSCQVPLVFLTVFPLYKHHTVNHVTNRRYVTLMKRIGGLTTICLISDIATVIASIFLIEFFTPQQVNLVINLTCVMLTPTNWKEKILPCSVYYQDQPEGGFSTYRQSQRRPRHAEISSSCDTLSTEQSPMFARKKLRQDKSGQDQPIDKQLPMITQKMPCQENPPSDVTIAFQTREQVAKLREEKSRVNASQSMQLMATSDPINASTGQEEITNEGTLFHC